MLKNNATIEQERNNEVNLLFLLTIVIYNIFKISACEFLL
jgi:hypothetical protein